MRCWSLILVLSWGLALGEAFSQSTLVGNSVVPVGLLVFQPTVLPPSLERFEGQDIFLPIAFGTGFVVSDAGYVVTALHVIRRAESRLPEIQSAAKQMVVCLRSAPEPPDCKEVEIVGMDEWNDLALLKIKNPKLGDMIHALHLGSRRPARGTEVWAAGYPARTGGRLVVSPGIFDNGDVPEDGRNRNGVPGPAPRMWLADMSVEEGTSGGPVYLHDGSVIGVVVTRSAGHTVVGFIPAQHVIDLLVRHGLRNLPTDDSRRPPLPGQ